MNIEEIIKDKVLVLDGAMGTMIQREGLSEADFRGDLFADHHQNLAGCNDVLVLSRPDVIAGIHDRYLRAGADIVTTCTFNSNAISLGEYGLSDYVRQINLAAARLARSCADLYSTDIHPRFVAGDMGPSGVALSMGQTEVDFDALAATYAVQAGGLIDGGVDLLLIETVFDPINCKAAIAGALDAMAERGKRVPMMISATLTETGRLLSGQSLEAFLVAISHANPMAVGINCGFGVEALLPYLDVLDATPWYVGMHANAGLPDALGQYTETPERMASQLAPALAAGKLNIVGGCCGTTPEHIRAIASLPAVPHVLPVAAGKLRLSGQEVMPDKDFVKVGERCNVAGSRKFLRLISEGNYGEAVEIAAGQVTAGADVIDVNMDDGLLDTKEEIVRFVDMLALDSEASQVPLMIDSSSHEVIIDTLKHIQGKPVVNSISLKEGEEVFIDHARQIRRLGAAVVVMAFDENGQATSRDRKIAICDRAYRLLTEQVGFPPEDIIFDPNVLTVATGMEEHDRYGLDFVEATEWIHRNLPGAGVSGGVSNLSFAFRGNDPLRRDMHTVFVDHCRRVGMTMAILNPSTPLDPSTIDPERRTVIEEALFDPSSAHSLALTDYAMANMPRTKQPMASPGAAKAQLQLDEMVYRGVTDRLEQVVAEALEADGSAMAVVNGRLMPGMNRVGDDFGAGRMFLPQVVKSASVMKRAFELLAPAMEAEKASGSHDGKVPRMVLATVKGDVHDIGKNIVAAVMRCSGFEVDDLGVMVAPERIVDHAVATGADLIGVSGLITPSLTEMTRVAEEMDRRGLTIPLFVGGATTSPLHTALKIAPQYGGGVVVHTSDAASLPSVARALTDESTAATVSRQIADEQGRLRSSYQSTQTTEVTRRRRVKSEPSVTPLLQGLLKFEISPADLLPLINRKALLAAWQMNPALAPTATCDCCSSAEQREAARILDEADALVRSLTDAGVKLRANVYVTDAHRSGDDIVADEGRLVIPTLRQNVADGQALADYVAEGSDSVALFVVTAGSEIHHRIEAARRAGSDYEALLLQSVADRLAEAATEWVHRKVGAQVWGYDTAKSSVGIRPAVGYPSLPDQSLVWLLDQWLCCGDLDVTITENGALSPSATTMGLMLPWSDATYFSVGKISGSQADEYARRRDMPIDRMRQFLASVI